MTQRLFGASWYVDITYQSKRYRIKSPENSKKGAKAFEATLRRRLAQGKSIRHKEQIEQQSFKKFAWFWFNTYVQVHNKPSTAAKARYVLTNKLVPYFGRTSLDAITTLQIEKYKARQANKGLANKTINNELSILGKCLRDATKWGFLKTVPDIAWLKLPPAHYVFLQEQECSQLLSHLTDIWFDIVYVGLKTGLRRGELQGLQWEDINFANQTLTVRRNWCSVTRTPLSPKGNRTRTVPLTSDTVALLAERKQHEGFVLSQDGAVFQPKALGSRLALASEQAGLPKVTLHVLRHTYASQLAMKGVPIAIIQQLLGHTDIKITMRYAHLSQSVLKDAVAQLEAPQMNCYGQYTGKRDVLERQPAETNHTCKY